MVKVFITIDWEKERPCKKLKNEIDDFIEAITEMKIEYQLKYTTLPKRNSREIFDV